MKPLASLALIGFATCSLTATTFAQDTIGRAVELVDPSLSARVVYEVPPFNIDHTGPCEQNPRPPECSATDLVYAVQLGVDASGNTYSLSTDFTIFDASPISKYGVALLRTTPGGQTTIAGYLVEEFCDGFQCSPRTVFRFGQQISLDVTNGRILIPLSAEFFLNNIEYARLVGLVEIGGLPKLFDTLLTFIPGRQAMNILTPAHPDGFRSADSLQVWTGNVRSMPDWSQAQPLACTAAANPVPGQVVPVLDTLADPPVGEGRYYLAASESGADRRLGRRYMSGAFSAREPSGLPACQ